MRLAIISDVHGNDRALEAVLKDTQKQAIDVYIFGGDYYCDAPYPNEVVNRIKKLDKKHVIRGNKEDYLKDLHKTDESQRIHDQFNSLYWNYNELSKENIEYLLGLPKTIHIDVEGRKIMILHSISEVFKGTKLNFFSSSRIAEKMDEKEFSHQEFLTYVADTLSKDKEFQHQLMAREEDIFIFGHTHVQWYIQSKGKLLINAGSCGVPLDFCTNAPYTILEVNGGQVKVEERRIAYDLDTLIQDIRESGLYKSAENWMEVMIRHYTFARDDIAFFFRYLYKAMRENGEEGWPIPNETWNREMKNWLSMKGRN